MKRNVELVRNVLVALEANDDPANVETVLVEFGFSKSDINYHFAIMHEAGLIEAIDASTMSEFRWCPVRLTWKGNEWLDAFRCQVVWNKTHKIADRVKSMSMEMMFEIANNLCREIAEG